MLGKNSRNMPNNTGGLNSELISIIHSDYYYSREIEALISISLLNENKLLYTIINERLMEQISEHHIHRFKNFLGIKE